MIAGNIIDKIYKMHIEAKKDEGGTPQFAVYIGRSTWHEMMGQLSGDISGAAWEIRQNKGERIAGCNVYQVIDDCHGWKVFRL
jgi:hypothetical protein